MNARAGAQAVMDIEDQTDEQIDEQISEHLSEYACGQDDSRARQYDRPPQSRHR